MATEYVIDGTRATSIIVPANSTGDDVWIRGLNGPSQDTILCSPTQQACVGWAGPYSGQRLRCIIENVTLDGQNLPGPNPIGVQGVGAGASGPLELVLRNCRVINTPGFGVISGTPNATLTIEGLYYNGSGHAVRTSNSAVPYLSDISVVQGRSGYVKSDDGFIATGGVIRNMSIERLDEYQYWNMPGDEMELLSATATSFIAPTMPSFAGSYRYDQARVVDDEGRVVLGRIFTWTAVGDGTYNVVVERWRYPETNDDAPTPTPRPVRIIDRDTLDIGNIHLTDGCRSFVLDNVVCNGGWADQITVRGPLPHTLIDCRAGRGQDMGYTIDGPHRLYRCVAYAQNVDLFFLFNDIRNYEGENLPYIGNYAYGPHLGHCYLYGHGNYGYNDRYLEPDQLADYLAHAHHNTRGAPWA